MLFGAFTKLCNLCHNLYLEHFIIAKKKPDTHKYHSLLFISPHPNLYEVTYSGHFV